MLRHVCLALDVLLAMVILEEPASCFLEGTELTAPGQAHRLPRADAPLPSLASAL